MTTWLYVSACLPHLHTLQITHNKLKTVDSIRHLVECEELSCVDLAHNRLDDADIVDVFTQMKTLV